MRSAIVIPLAMSLALHVGLAWFASRVTLPRRDTPISANLTIGLTVLPTTSAAPETPKATEESAASARPAEVKSDAAPTSKPTAPPQDTRAEAVPAAQAENPRVEKIAPEAPPETAAAAPAAAQAPAAPPTNLAKPDPIPAASSETPPSLDKGETPAASAPDVVAGTPAPDVTPTSALATDATASQGDERIAAAQVEPVPEAPGAEPTAAAPVAAEASQSTPILSAAEPASVVPQAADAVAPQGDERIAAAQAEPVPEAPGAETTVAAPVSAEASQSTPALSAEPAIVPPQVDERIEAVQTGPVPEAPGTEALAVASLPEVASQSAPASARVETALPPQQAQLPAVTGEAPATAPLEAPEASAKAVASAEIADPESAAAIRRATAFVDGYDGGPCVYLSAERIDADVADVDGFATTSDAFGRFHQAFAAVAGFEPAVTGQKIWKPQCPAVDVLRRLRTAHTIAPALRLEAVNVRHGAALRGSIRDPLHRSLHLYWVSEAGTVRDLSAKLVISDEGARFTLDLDHGGTPDPPPQMLLVLAGDPARPSGPGDDAATVFAALLQTQGAGAPPGAAAKLFLLRD